MKETGKTNGPLTTQERRPARLLAWPEELERYFRDWSLRFWRRPGERAAWLPDIDVFEKDGKVVVRTDLPGMAPDNIDVSIEGDILTIKGRREEAREVKEEDYYCCERATGEFLRTVRLPEGCTADGVEARYDNGVLEVTVPRPAKPEQAAVKVPVK